MTEQKVTLDELKERRLEDVLMEVADQQERVAVLLPDGREVVKGELVEGEPEWGPLWEKTRKDLDTYKGWDQQGLRLTLGRRCPFELQNLPDLCLHTIGIDNIQVVDQFTFFKLMIAGAIFLFQQEREYVRFEEPKYLFDLKEKEFSRRAKPHLVEVREGIEGIRSLLKELKALGARGDRTQYILKALETVMGLIADRLYHEIEARIAYKEPPKRRNQTLVHDLDEVFCIFTTLGYEERARHIAGLIAHFELWEPKAEAIQRTIADGRKPKPSPYASLLRQIPR